MTIWKPIRGFEDRYEVSDDGRVASIRYHQMDIRQDLKPYDVRGYKIFVLQKNARREARQAHIIVAEAFVGKRKTGFQVNHIDGNKSNNRASNLEWVTASENIKHSYSIKLHSQKGENNAATHLANKSVSEIKRLVREKKITQRKIAEMFNISPAAVCMIGKGKTWAHID